MKITVLFLIIILTSPQFAQPVNVKFNSQYNIKRFADFLFCGKDYLRAAAEYERLTGEYTNDTLQFKKALTYSHIKDYSSAINSLSRINSTSTFFNEAQMEQLKIKFLLNNFGGLRSFYNSSFTSNTKPYGSEGKKLFNFSYLFTDEGLPSKEEFLTPFAADEKKEVSRFYDLKENRQYKDPTFAGILSAIIPGSGKIYTGDTGDGVVAFLTSAVFSFIAYDNFKADHNTRAWIWTGVAALFYAGNVYGSIASAQIYNAKIAFDFNEKVKFFLQERNYFTPEYDFCK